MNYQRIRDISEAMAVVHGTRRLDLVESLRAWAELLTEALAMNDSPPETWLG